MASQEKRQFDENDLIMSPEEICAKSQLICTYTKLMSRRRNMKKGDINRRKYANDINKILLLPLKELKALEARIDLSDKEKRNEILIQHMFVEYNL